MNSISGMHEKKQSRDFRGIIRFSISASKFQCKDKTFFAKMSEMNFSCGNVGIPHEDVFGRYDIEDMNSPFLGSRRGTKKDLVS